MDPYERLVEALHQVKWHHDGTLTFRRSLRARHLRLRRDGDQRRNALACKVLVKDVAPKVTIEPIRGLAVLKDLIVDMEPFFDGYRAVLPYLVNDEETERERVQMPEERERYDDTTKCILCAACTTSCPIFWSDETYIGPGRDRERASVHLRLARSRPARAARHPVREDRRLPLPDDVQLHRRVSARHRGHQGDPGSEARRPFDRD